MNKRLQELYLDAAKHMQMVQQQGLPAPYQTRALAGKFAELILQECGVALSPMLRDMVSRGQAYDLIKQHFGVDE